MTEEEYRKFLKIAPKDHFSSDFKLFLINNNKIRFFSGDWLVIENKKYWNKENDWLTAFCFAEDRENFSVGLVRLYDLHKDFPESRNREWRIKAPEKRTVKLFHVHIYKK